MRRITLIFALLLSLMGVRQANAGTLTATFDRNVGLPEGWSLVGDVTNDDTRSRSGYGLWTSSKSTTDNYVITEAVEGTFEFYARAYNKSYASTVVVYEYTGSGLGTQLYTTGSMYASSTPSWSKYSFSVENGTQLAIVLNYAAIDDVTYTQYEQVEGPALKVAGDDNGSLNFGMVNPGATKDLTLSNPGTEAITVNITTTGGFTTDASKTITAGGNVTLSIAAPDESATGKVTITPTVTTVAAVTINLSCTVKDPAKVYETLGDGTAPEEWKATSWSFTTGYAYTTSWYQSSNARLVTPLLNVLDGETFAFEAMGTYDGYQSLVFEYSVDGTNWTASSTTITLGSEWASYTISDIPAGTYYIALHGSQVRVRNFYGGELDQTPRPKLEVEGIANGGSLSWGWSDVPAGDTKTITLKNDGTADLDVTIAATDDYTVDPTTATVAAGETVVVTIGTPAHDGNGVLTITPAEGSGLSPYTISLSSYYKEPKPVMSLDKTSITFGRINEVKSETITVSNTGDGKLVATIANDNTDNFTVEPSELTVNPGETGEITITYNYVEGTWGTFKANVKVTPNYGGTYDVKTITVSATSKDPNVWSEDFEEGTLPTTWNNEGGWTVSEPTASGSNGSYMATIRSSNPKSLTTPRLEAKAGETLTFYVGMQYDDEPLTIEYTNDEAKAAWTKVVEPVTASGEITFTAPADGFYYIRFTGTYAMLDDFNGFKLAMKDHEIEISGSNIPAEGTQFAEYTATATVKELVGVEEEATAKLYVNGEEVATATETVSANGTATITLTYVPQEAIENGVAKIVVTYAGGEITTDEVAMSIAPALTLDETAENFIYRVGNEAAVVVKYTPKAGWNTICLPFALTSDILTQIFGEGWKAYEFSGYADGALSFKPATMFAAGYPYIVYSKAPVANENGFVVNNVNVSADEPNADSYGGTTFQGTYSPIVAPNMEGMYGVVPSTGKIQKGSAKASLKGLRAYFELPEGTTVKELGINYEDDATGISQFVATPENGAIYDLNGNKVKNLVKGQVYIMNGQKVLIK
ncbi:MAG: choice-of-anchor D domain-containing protein [Bacteroidaceae bacterium]|nr:choice-of-anchor D domain-containing protein [Bacteroidaceae bacterium]